VRTPRTSARSGFTLVEILAALGILLFGMAAILGLLTFGAALTRTAELRTTAANAIEAVVLDLEEGLFPIGPDGEAGEPAAVEGREIPGTGVRYTAVATPNPDQPLEYRVDVEASWETGGVRRSKRFTTLLIREIPFGERLRRRFVEPKGGGLEAEAGAGEAAR
jgi:type II secretory pathway pseudopilin PulG